VTEEEVAKFWNAHPCGDHQVGGLGGDYEEFFQRYDRLRYTTENHILACLDRIEFKGKRVLEIGLGQGADSEQIIRRGAIWSGLDLTPESVDRVTMRLKCRRLSFERIECGSAIKMPFPSGEFDIVFSHGVLHHIPNIRLAQSEISRVLRPGGELIVMLYAKRSLNYLLAIGLVRRLAVAALYPLYAGSASPDGIVGQHIINAREVGLWRYLRMENFIHRNTDGPLNPYSKVYDLATIRRDFPDFAVVRSYQRSMHAPPLPVQWLPLERLLGWHLWVHMLRSRQ
jgi:SAM-dependent methyltransferase